MMDAGMELAEYFIEKMNQFIDSNFKVKKAVSNELVTLAGSVTAYVLTFIMLTRTKKLSLKVHI